jgi:mRNA-degrading endonuclease RelE of RelBE toxin-antitoxin system
MLTVTMKMTIIMVKMTPDSAFEILYAPIVRQHLSAIEHKYYSLIREAIEEHLSYEPDRITRNRKPLKQPAQNGAQWELRCGPNNRFRIFYTADQERREVVILAIGEKQGSCLMLGSEEVVL